MDREAGTRIRVSLRTEPEPRPEREEIPRIVRLLALAHRWHRQLDEGVYGSQAEIARMTGLTRARVTQIMDPRYHSPRTQAGLAVIVRHQPVTLHKRWPHSAYWSNSSITESGPPNG